MNLKNSVRLKGNLGNDPDTFNGGCSFRIATNERYKNKNGEMVNDTQWHSCVCWGNLSALAVKYLKKGSNIDLEGKLKYDEYEDDNGKKVKRAKIVINSFDFLDKPQAKEEGTKAYNNKVTDEDLNDLPF